MAKKDRQYACQDCGAVHSKWLGQCPDCGSWNSIVEELLDTSKKTVSFGEKLDFAPLDHDIEENSRIGTGISELDRVLGGGLVAGSAILIGGDPGIGKSTLLLQLVSKMADNNVDCAYITGEESTNQVRLRAKRLGLNQSSVRLLSATNIGSIIELLERNLDLSMVVIDSIQTMFSDDLMAAPGTVSQVKASAFELISFAKKHGIILLLVGHVTKEGQLAGPKVLEHMVDTVLYFEGERNHHFRILRAVKNRFGGVNEIGVFEMQEQGLVELINPSSIFLSPMDRKISGSAVFAGIEGTRPILAEIQALVAKSYIPMPRRSVVGWDLNRLSMILAVLAVRYGASFHEKDVYLNIVGGLKINDPAADLAVATSLISAISNAPLPAKTIIFGEVGLSGEIRRVSHSEGRLKEAARLGFENAIIPFSQDSINSYGLQLQQVGHVKQLLDLFKSP